MVTQTLLKTMDRIYTQGYRSAFILLSAKLARSEPGPIPPITVQWPPPVKGDKTKQASIFCYPFFLAWAHYQQKAWRHSYPSLCFRGYFTCFHFLSSAYKPKHTKDSPTNFSLSLTRQSGLHSKVSYYYGFILFKRRNRPVIRLVWRFINNIMIAWGSSLFIR